MKKFKQGDIIRCLENHTGDPRHFTKGNLYVFTGYTMDLSRLSVKKDDTGNPNGWAAELFRLVEDPSALIKEFLTK